MSALSRRATERGAVSYLGAARPTTCRQAELVRNSSGQATVELAVVFPVVIIVAVILVNAALFFSECSAFDRQFRNAVRACAASPAYGQDQGSICAQIKRMLDEAIERDYLEVQVDCSGGGFGLTTFTATAEFSPTLFGLGMKSEVFGVGLPKLRHTSSLTVDCYKPGMLL